MSLLQTRSLRAFYGDFQALFDVDVTVEEGDTIAVIGANGAGRTTFLRAITGALPCADDMVIFDGQPIGGRTAHEIVRLGIAMVPEGRRLFPASRLRKTSCSARTADVPVPGRSPVSTNCSRCSPTIAGARPRSSPAASSR